LAGLATQFPGIATVANSQEIGKIAHACEGLDGRALRKMVVNAMAMSREVAADPNKLTAAHLLAAAKEAKLARSRKGDLK